tara:strand:- start:541 stop:1002 length:462 start_codon:yes stop_codon:yes gene_type:complete
MNVEQLEKIYKKVNNILMNTNNSDYDRYLKLRKTKGSNGEYYDKDKATKIIYTWLMDNAEYNEEKDRYNGHNWRLEYMNRFEELIVKIDKESNNNSSKKRVNLKLSKKKILKENLPKKVTPKKNSPKKVTSNKNSPKKVTPNKNINKSIFKIS